MALHWLRVNLIPVSAYVNASIFVQIVLTISYLFRHPNALLVLYALYSISITPTPYCTSLHLRHSAAAQMASGWVPHSSATPTTSTHPFDLYLLRCPNTS